MSIDWFTITAQILNFLILVWLLKRFLYRPILLAIEEREKQIAADLADAEKIRTEAKKERDEFEKKNRDFEEQQKILMKKATDEIKIERQRLLAEAEKAATSLREKRALALSNEINGLTQEIRRRTQSEVFAISRMVLHDLASASLEERICDVFILCLEGMDKQKKELLGAAIKSSQHPAIICSSLELELTQRTAIRNVLDKIFAAEIDIEFQTAPDLVSGIELTVNGQKISWSIDGYLAALEDRLGVVAL